MQAWVGGDWQQSKMIDSQADNLNCSITSSVRFSAVCSRHWTATGFMEQGHCGACRRKRRLTDTDLCPCGETQTMSHTVESCPLTKLNGGLSRLHSADEDAVLWLTSYGSWNAYAKKKTELNHSYIFIIPDTRTMLRTVYKSPLSLSRLRSS